MTPDLHATLAAVSGLGELGLLILAGFIGFRDRGCTFAEAAAYGTMAPLMALSFLFQAAFIAGIPDLAMVVETGLVIAALWVVARRSGRLVRDQTVLRFFFARHPLPCLALSVAGGLLAIQAFAALPRGVPWQQLWPVLGFEKYGTFFATGYYSPTSALVPVNALMLPHLFLRFHTGLGVGIFGFLAFLSIGFSTYALSRRYAWTPTAATVTFGVMSMPRLVVQAVTPGLELVPAAAAALALVALYRAVEQPHILDLLMLVLAVLFGISGDRLCLVLPAILIGLACLVLFRRHGARTWWQIIRRGRWYGSAALVPALVFSQIWLFAYNIGSGKPWVGDLPGGFAGNGDGIQGSLANLFRYLLESAHLTRPVDLAFEWVTGVGITGVLNGVHDLVRRLVMGDLGASAPFSVSWEPAAAGSWFGPLGFFLVLPAVAYALVRGPRRLKAVAVAMVGYVYVVTLAVAWAPGNARYFTVVFACCGFMTAFFLPPWRFSSRGQQRLQWISALLLFHGCAAPWL